MCLYIFSVDSSPHYIVSTNKCQLLLLLLPLSPCMLSHFSHVRLCVTLQTVALQASLSMGFFRQECWSGLPCPPPGDLPDPGIEPESLTSPALAGGFFTIRATWQVQSLQHTLTLLSILHPLTLYVMTEVYWLSQDCFFFCPKSLLLMTSRSYLECKH